MTRIQNFKSTITLYGVSPSYFEDLKYYEAIEEKIKLAKKRINELNNEIVLNFPNYDYVAINSQLRLCEKALRFNEKLLDEYKMERHIL